MNIAVIGCGYVGLVTGTCLSDLGHQVVCVDKDVYKIKLLNQGKVPIFEPGLEEMVTRNASAGRLSFSAKIAKVISKAEIVFIAVGTPARPNGEADVSAVEAVANEIAKAWLKLKKSKTATRSQSAYKVVVNKSTVPVGMGDIVTKILVKSGVAKENFAVVSNPEFLKEGSAVVDFMRPDRIVIGAHDSKAFNLITELYRPLNAHIVFTSVKSAELIKYASNAFLATKISFINEIANICDLVGSDVAEIADAIGLDKRIGRSFLNAGLGWGGSCFPKDVAALIHLAHSKGYGPKVLEAISNVNQAQIKKFVAKIVKVLKKIKGKNLTVLGVSFKPNTDDLREAPSLKLIKLLLAMGAKIKVYDPIIKTAQRLGLPAKQQRLVKLCKNPYVAAKHSDALIIVTEWPEFFELDYKKIKPLMKTACLFDGRNIVKPKKVKELGFKYFGVGR